MRSKPLDTARSASADPYPRHPGIEDVLDCAPDEVHALILLLAAMVKEIGIEAAVEVLGRESVHEGVSSRPGDNPGLFEDPPRDTGHPFDPYKGALQGSNGLAAKPYRVPPFNVITARKDVSAVCLPTVVALAHGTKAPRGLAMTLRLLREHLIRCGCGPKGLHSRSAIVVTDAWSSRAAYESSRDLAAHQDMTGLNVVVMHWDGMRWRRREF